MSIRPLATLCLFTAGNHFGSFRPCLDSILATTPADTFPFRLGFHQAPLSLHYALGRLCQDAEVPRHVCLPGGIERFGWHSAAGLPVHLWSAVGDSDKDGVVRCLCHDVPLETDYLIWLQDTATVASGWWQQLLPLLERGIDCIGWLDWLDYQPGQVQMVQQQPWYRGRSPALQSGKAGVSCFREGFVALRSRCLREADFPPTHLSALQKRKPSPPWGVLLGEMAHQLGWSLADGGKFIQVPELAAVSSA